MTNVQQVSTDINDAIASLTQFQAMFTSQPPGVGHLQKALRSLNSARVALAGEPDPIPDEAA